MSQVSANDRVVDLDELLNRVDEHLSALRLACEHMSGFAQAVGTGGCELCANMSLSVAGQCLYYYGQQTLTSGNAEDYQCEPHVNMD